MTQEHIIATNKKSELEQLEQDERNELAKAGMKAVELLNIRHRRPTYFGDDQPDEAIRDTVRQNVHAVEVETHRYDEQNN